MTSRRELFGLLAAAPLVAPAVVKAATSQTEGSVIAGTIPVAYGERVHWTHYPSFEVINDAQPGFYSSENGLMLNMRDGRTITLIGDCIIEPLEPDVLNDAPGYYFKPDASPSRLYGVQINADGDAV